LEFSNLVIVICLGFVICYLEFYSLQYSTTLVLQNSLLFFGGEYTTILALVKVANPTGVSSRILSMIQVFSRAKKHRTR